MAARCVHRVFCFPHVRKLEAAPAEIDHANKVWVVLPSRMKARKEHRVPLSGRAAEIAGMGDGAYLFPGARANTVDAMSMRRLLEKMGYGERASVHGFRSTFRDWAAERTATPREVCEQALAHTSATRSKPLTGGATCSTSAGGS